MVQSFEVNTDPDFIIDDRSTWCEVKFMDGILRFSPYRSGGGESYFEIRSGDEGYVNSAIVDAESLEALAVALMYTAKLSREKR